MIGWRLTADIGSLLSPTRKRREWPRCHDATLSPPVHLPIKAYSPNDVEEVFCELRPNGVLRSSPSPSPTPMSAPPHYPLLTKNTPRKVLLACGGPGHRTGA